MEPRPVDVHTYFVMVKIYHRGNKISDMVQLVNGNETFSDLFSRSLPSTSSDCNNNYSSLMTNVYISQDAMTKDRSASGTKVDLHHPVSAALSFNFRHITYYVQEADLNEKSSSSGNKKSAFDILMSARRDNTHLPPKKDKEKLIATEQLFNDVIDYMGNVGVGFTKEDIHVGTRAASQVRDALWLLDSHHEKFKARGIAIPLPFQSFKGRNKWKENKHQEPSLTKESLSSHIEKLSTLLLLPVVQSSRNKKFVQDVSSLCEAMVQYRTYLQQVSDRVSQCRASTTPVRNPEVDAGLRILLASSTCSKEYQSLQKCLDNTTSYQPINISEFAPVDRFERRKFIANLQVTHDVAMYTMPYGNYLGTVTLLWRVERERHDHESLNASVIMNVSKRLPIYSTREMRRSFISKYSNKANLQPMFLRTLYKDLTQDSAAAESYDEAMIDDRVKQFFLETEEADILCDLRKCNGNPGSTIFQPFWDETAKLVAEASQVNERRHVQEYMYLPFVISVEDLQRKVKARMPPGSAIPSAEWIRLQFWPTNPFTNRAVRHTFRFDVKYAVQSRVLRLEHVDAKYASTQFKYMKEFACKYKEYTKMICLDDKAIVPVGEPEHAVSSGVRGHNKSLVPVGTTLVALDHDWHVGGVIPSVVLINQVPESTDGSFHRGRVFVTTKEKVFQPSTPARHATEVCNILRSFASSDDVNLDCPILLVYTDGGPDHRVTYLTVKLSYIALFIALDLDVLIAARCAPNASWMNPAERVMSVLNLALQNVSIAREKMADQFEARVKGKSDLKGVRQVAETCPGFQEAFNTALQPVKELVNERFRRMQLKGERIETHEAASDEQIEEIMNVLSIIDSDLTGRSAMSMQAKDLEKYGKLSDFLKTHTKQTHYTFQVKKCSESDCFACNLCPPRLPADVFETIAFLPDPTLDVSREHYKKFAEVYGCCTSEEDRPSLKPPNERNETDKKRSRLLVAGKVRMAIRCALCLKPRCVFSNSKLQREEEAAVRRLSQSGVFTCGSNLFEEGGRYHDGIVARAAVSCTSPVEAQYYSSTLVSFPDCCIHCGREEELLGPEHPTIATLRQQYAVVRPMCLTCFNDGKAPKTWGAQNARKKIRRV